MGWQSQCAGDDVQNVLNRGLHSHVLVRNNARDSAFGNHAPEIVFSTIGTLKNYVMPDARAIPGIASDPAIKFVRQKSLAEYTIHHSALAIHARAVNVQLAASYGNVVAHLGPWPF
jgi:hypothetical protein